MALISDCNGTKADIVFLLDMSSSVRALNFEIMKTFVMSVVSVLDIGRNKTKVGLITFSRYPRLEIHCNDFANGVDLLKAINKVAYYPGECDKQVCLLHQMANLYVSGQLLSCPSTKLNN